MTNETGVIEETPWHMSVNGRRVAAGTLRPGRVRAMAAGRLLADGWIVSAEDLLSLEVEDDAAGLIAIRARVPDARFAAAAAEWDHRAATGCGPLHFVRCDAAGARAERSLPVPPLDAFPALFRALFAAADRASPTGGIHVAALTDGVTLLEPCDDVSRHAAVDKALGAVLLAGRAPGTVGVLVTARISGEMAQKAARAGVAWVASRSVPTTLAVAIAEAAQLPLVARAPRPDAAVTGGVTAAGGAR